MKTIEIVSIHAVLASLMQDSEKQPRKFSYAVARSFSKVAPIAEMFMKHFDQTDANLWPNLAPWHVARTALLVSLSNKNPDGSAMRIGNNYALREGVDLAAEFEKLNVGFPNLKADQEEWEEAQRAAGEMDEQVELFKLSIDDFPQTISPQMMLILLPMVAE